MSELKQIMRSKGNSILRWLALAVPLVLAGCGGGGGESSVNAVVAGTSTPHAEAASAFTITSDDYGMQNATFLSASSSAEAVTLRAAIASSLTDPSFRTTVRIDIDRAAQVRTGTVYSLAAGGSSSFPGTVYFFDGHPSSLLQTVAGSITFTSFGTSQGDRIAGSFTATVKDGNDSSGSTYTVAADFSFNAGSQGALTPAATPVPAGAAASYDAHCASCHSLGSYDTTASSASDLALKGGKLRELLVPDTASHQGVRLAASEIGGLKVLLNAN